MPKARMRPGECRCTKHGVEYCYIEGKGVRFTGKCKSSVRLPDGVSPMEFCYRTLYNDPTNTRPCEEALTQAIHTLEKQGKTREEICNALASYSMQVAAATMFMTATSPDWQKKYNAALSLHHTINKVLAKECVR